MLDVDDATSVCTAHEQTLAQACDLVCKGRKQTNLSLLAGERLHVAFGAFTTATRVVEAELAAVVAFVIEVVDRGGRVVGNGALDVWDSCGAGDSKEEGETEKVEELHCVEVVGFDV
jgi:hypothetical protein